MLSIEKAANGCRTGKTSGIQSADSAGGSGVVWIAVFSVERYDLLF